MPKVVLYCSFVLLMPVIEICNLQETVNVTKFPRNYKFGHIYWKNFIFGAVCEIIKCARNIKKNVISIENCEFSHVMKMDRNNSKVWTNFFEPILSQCSLCVPPENIKIYWLTEENCCISYIVLHSKFLLP